MDLTKRRDELVQRLNQGLQTMQQAAQLVEQLKGAIQILDEQLHEPPPNRATRRAAKTGKKK